MTGICRRVVSALGLLALLVGAPVEAGETELGGDVRYYQILSTEEGATDRKHVELGIARLKLTSDFTDSLRLEVHGAVSIAAPGLGAGATSIAAGSTGRLLDLEADLIDEPNLQAVAELDRFSLRWDHARFRLAVGRQTMSWGVSYFWPVLDLFAPFPPHRIDREYKPGIDALRLTIPVGDFSEVEAVAAGLGERYPEDFSLATLGRFHVSRADIGFMGGRFHTDTVLGTFITTDVSGTGVRAELAFTESGDEADAERNRGRFWRTTLGLDRQLTPGLMLSGEVSYNGFGASEPEDYSAVAQADRASRGEVTSLGRFYAGVSLGWQAHPLISVRGVLLANLEDGSTLVQPLAEWSVSENLAALIGASLGLGPGEPGDQRLRSEYGGAPLTFYGALRFYF